MSIFIVIPLLAKLGAGRGGQRTASTPRVRACYIGLANSISIYMCLSICHPCGLGFTLNPIHLALCVLGCVSVYGLATPCILALCILAVSRYCFTSKLYCGSLSSFYCPHPGGLTCNAYPIIIRSHDNCAMYAPPLSLPLYAMYHTTLVMAISCKGQVAWRRNRSTGAVSIYIYLSIDLSIFLRINLSIYLYLYLYDYLYTFIYVHVYI